MSHHASEAYLNYGWACVCEQCAANRQAKPPTAAQVEQFADLIAERNRVGQQAPKRVRKRGPKRRPDAPDW
jgi:hypothetical protein